PDVRAPLAVRAAEAGRHLLLDKPLATTVEGAREVVDAVDRAGVRSVVFFTLRFAPTSAEWITEQAGTGGWTLGRADWYSPVFGGADSPYTASPWRREKGALWDVGPHALSVLLPILGDVPDLPRDGSDDGSGGGAVAGFGDAVTAARKLAARERDQARLAAHEALDDPLVMAARRLAGEAFTGEVVAVEMAYSQSKRPTPRPLVTVRTDDHPQLGDGSAVFRELPEGRSQSGEFVDAPGPGLLTVRLTGGMGRGREPAPGSVPSQGQRAEGGPRGRPRRG
ncbi:Gfo/Idh/MocA family protein, partial [Streptomyces sparsus]